MSELGVSASNAMADLFGYQVAPLKSKAVPEVMAACTHTHTHVVEVFCSSRRPREQTTTRITTKVSD
eukprot:3882888-Amphidinium_carterae.1